MNGRSYRLRDRPGPSADAPPDSKPAKAPPGSEGGRVGFKTSQSAPRLRGALGGGRLSRSGRAPEARRGAEPPGRGRRCREEKEGRSSPDTLNRKSSRLA